MLECSGVLLGGLNLLVAQRIRLTSASLTECHHWLIYFKRWGLYHQAKLLASSGPLPPSASKPGASETLHSPHHLTGESHPPPEKEKKQRQEKIKPNQSNKTEVILNSLLVIGTRENGLLYSFFPPLARRGRLISCIITPAASISKLILTLRLTAK